MSIKLNAKKIYRPALRLIALFTGLFLVANGIVLTLNAELGVNPWDVLHIGIAYQTGFSIGRVIQVLGLLLLVVSYLLKVKISIGTVLNVVFLGYFVDLIIGWGYVPKPESLLLRIGLFIPGVILFGFGIALYISANLGAGPRDSLMLALMKVCRFNAGVIRTGMEVAVATVGFLIGGPLGIGTVVFALSMGLFMELAFRLIRKLKSCTLLKEV